MSEPAAEEEEIRIALTRQSYHAHFLVRRRRSACNEARRVLASTYHQDRRWRHGEKWFGYRGRRRLATSC